MVAAVVARVPDRFVLPDGMGGANELTRIDVLRSKVRGRRNMNDLAS